jgi:group II intron reverse transcriptase/maturase
MRTAETILGLIGERGKKGLPLERVYKLLFNRDLYLEAYGKIYRNTGAMTHGITGETPDGMSLAKIDAIIEALRYERYQWLPARRVYIPKKNGKKRPLGLPVWSDKLVQEVLRQILEAYFEPQFSQSSHGFRPQRGCHTALREIYHKWTGTIWFIEGDIAHCFDKLSHEKLIEILSKQIHDTRFIKLIQELLEAGYMEEWTFNQTLSGVPQGGVVSPLLANILLHELDQFVENVLVPRYSRGTGRMINPEYHSLMTLSRYYRKRGNIKKAEELRDQAQRLPSKKTDDPNYRRLNYVRYADDFLLGFIGPRSEAEEIKQQLREFLREQLKLELSDEKTLLTHARSEAARFLGYEVTALQDNAKRTKRETHGHRTATMCRSINSRIGLRVPKDRLETKVKRYSKHGKAMHRKELERESDYTIVMTYQLEYRGIANYYRLAYNMANLNTLKWVMETSLTKTLAAKHKLSVAKVYEKYGVKLQRDGKEYKGLQVLVPKPDASKKPLVALWGGISLKWDMKAILEEQPPKVYSNNRTELVQRLLADFCELCGSDKDVEVHHVQAMRKLHEYPGRPKPEWVKRMIALKRKTLLLCKRCHEATDHGLPITWQLISLEEIKDRRKRSMTHY